MNKMEKGEVSFLSLDGKYGFISLVRNEVHFRVEFQVSPQVNSEGELVFVPLAITNSGKRRIPKLKDLLIFKSEPKKDGYVASYWFFDDEYQSILKWIKETTTIYRLVESSVGGTKEIWKGTSLKDFIEENFSKAFKYPLFRLTPTKYWWEYKLYRDTEWRQIRETKK